MLVGAGTAISRIPLGLPGLERLDHVIRQHDKEGLDLAVVLGLDLLEEVVELTGGEQNRKATDSLDVVHRLNSGVAGIGWGSQLDERS